LSKGEVEIIRQGKVVISEEFVEEIKPTEETVEEKVKSEKF